MTSLDNFQDDAMTPIKFQSTVVLSSYGTSNQTENYWVVQQTTQYGGIGGLGGQTKAIHAEYHLTIVYLTIGTFGFFANVYVISVIALYKPMHKQWTNIYIVNQSAIDSVVALFLFFTTLFQDNKEPRTRGYLPDELLCRLWYTKLPLWGMLMSSTYAIVSLTFERFLAVVLPIWHKTKFRKSLVAGTILLTWIVGPTYFLVYAAAAAEVTPSGECTVYTVYPSASAKSVAGVSTIVVQFIFPLILLTIFYGRMAIVLHRRVEPVGQHTDGETKRNESMARARSNVIKTLALVAFFLILCWSTNQIYYLLYNLGLDLSFTSTFYNFTVIMVFINCCINPIVYSLKYEQILNPDKMHKTNEFSAARYLKAVTSPESSSQNLASGNRDESRWTDK